MRAAELGEAPIPRREEVGGLRQGPRRRRPQRALLPLRDAARQGEEPALRPAGGRALPRPRPHHRRKNITPLLF